MKRAASAVLVAIIILMIIFAVAAVTAKPAPAHEAASGWSYDSWCCGGSDCRTAEPGEVVPTDTGWLIVPTGQVIPYTASGTLDDTEENRAAHLLKSKDDDIHMCAPFGTQVRCLYVPEFGF